jgi:hypothetical protein
MRLDTLIVSKTRPARIGNDRNAAARALEGEAGRIDIAQRLNGWIGERCRRRRHKHRLVLENESHGKLAIAHSVAALAQTTVAAMAVTTEGGSKDAAPRHLLPFDLFTAANL